MSDVVLVHGLWYRSWSMFRLREQLNDAGYTVHVFSYPTLTRNPAQNAADLADFCVRQCAGSPHLVGHSLGGLVIVAMLHQGQLPSVGRIVFLGTPLKGSLVARRLGSNLAGKRLLGQAVSVLSEGLGLIPGVAQYGMISGTCARGLGQLTGALGGANDGTVAVSETVSDQLSDRLELHVSHTGLLFSREAARQAAIFLDQGLFERGIQGGDATL